MINTYQMNRSSEQAFPVLAGYGLGSPIQKAILQRPHLDMQAASLKREVDAFKIIEESREQARVIQAFCLRKEKERELSSVNEQLNGLPQIESSKAEEMLPINTELSPIEMHKRSCSGEKFHHLIISKESTGETSAAISNAVRQFLFDLRSEETQTSSNLSLDTIESLTENIRGIIKTGHKVSLIGSFLTLPRVRVMDPIILRRDAVSDTMKINAPKYSVITEMVLGALFIGYGKCLSVNDIHDQETSTPKLVANISVFSFISLGAIPRLSGKSQDANLWETYLSWKEALFSDRESGYPIAIRVRDLTEILRENKIQLDNTLQSNQEK